MVKQVIASFGRGLNYDFCPGWNRYVYWLKRPIGWIVCAILFSALVGMLIGPQGFVLMWGLIAFLVVGAVWPWLGMKGIDCRLKFDVIRSEENQPTIGRLSVTNRWPFPVFGLTIEGQFLQDIFNDDDHVALGLHRVPAWSESEFIWEFNPERRGILPQEMPVIANGFPFGIYQSEKKIAFDRQIIVWPKCESLSSVRELDGVNFNIEGGFCDRPGHEGDVIGVRPYRYGDSTKHINWSKTAATGKLVVLERQTAAQKTIRIVLDLNPQHHQGVGSRGSYEWAIRIAATIISHLHHHHSRICLTCVGLPASFSGESTNTRGINPLLDFLAALPSREQLTAVNGESHSLNACGAVVRADEEVYWIGSDAAFQSRTLHGLPYKTHDIVLANGARNGETHEFDPTCSDEELVFVTDDWTLMQDQIRSGWERLCLNG